MLKHWPALVACVMLLGWVSSYAAGQATAAGELPGGTIQGKVIREGTVDGAVANAKVELFMGAAKKVIAAVRSDDKGAFVLENVPAGEGYTIRVFDGSQRAGAQGSKKDVSVKAGKSTDVGAITVHALPG